MVTTSAAGSSTLRTSPCTSAGRLFDGASALCGLGAENTFEGQAAMRLEACAAGRRGASGGGYPFSLRRDGGLLAIDWRDAVAGIVADRERAVPPEKVARRFHETVASMILAAASRLAEETGARHVLLSGGTFQNLLLLGRLLPALRARRLVPVIHHQVPCNDGGLALGQAFHAAAKLSGEG